MQVEVDIGFDQLIQLVKKLPASQWTKLKQQVEQEQGASGDKEREAFRQLLLSGPTFTKRQLDTIAKTRKEINKWRTK